MHYAMKLDMWLVNSKVKTLRILALDPGTANFGYAVVDLRVLENGKCEATVRTLKTAATMRQEMAEFEFWLGDICDRWKPQAVAAERYMTRGINGPTVECVNIMIGIVLTVLPLPFKIMPAATWKNCVSRQDVDLKEMYKKTMVTPHQVDAALIGVFTGCQAFKLQQFGDIDWSTVFPDFLRQLESTSTFKLINRKI
jgi:hypothetical protein